MAGFGCRPRLTPVLAVALVGCVQDQSSNAGSTAPTGYARFQQRINAGANCPELYEIRNEVRASDQASAGRMNEELRSIGCYSSDSSRTPTRSIPPTAQTAPSAAPVPSADCLSAMKEAAAEPTVVDGPQPGLLRTAQVCGTADEWLTALRNTRGPWGSPHGRRSGHSTCRSCAQPPTGRCRTRPCVRMPTRATSRSHSRNANGRRA